VFAAPKEPHAPAPVLAQVTLQFTPFGGVSESFVTFAAILAVWLVIRLAGGAFAPVAKLMLMEVEGIIGNTAVDEEAGFAVDVAVMVTLPAGLPRGMMAGAV
jgi:hypothetical protein